jgi:excisionase family DNA binding protein
LELNEQYTVSVEEAATILGVSRSFGYQLARDGTLPGVFQLGTRYRVNRSLLFEYMLVGRPAQHNPSCRLEHPAKEWE